jgi:hypothetical protein
MTGVDPKEHVFAGIRRQKSELDRIEKFVHGLSPHGFAILRDLLVRESELLPAPGTWKHEHKLAADRAHESNGGLDRLRTSMGSLKQAVLDAIQSLRLITSLTVHERLVAKGFQFSTSEPHREISSIAAWLRKLTEKGVLIQTRSGKGRRPAEFRKAKRRPN